MLPFPPFALERPDTLEDLVQINQEPRTRLLAGGTDLLPSLKHRLFEPRTLVSLARVPLMKAVHEEDGGITLGAGLTLRQVRETPLVRSRYPALAQACSTVATPTIQEAATLGGNVMLDTRCLYYNQPAGWREAIGGCLKANGDVCHVARTGSGCLAAHSADTVPSLWLLGARLRLHSTRGTREVPISDIFLDDGRNWLDLRPGEVLTAIHLPDPAGSITVHRKLRARAAIDYPLLLTAIQLGTDRARAVVSAVGPRPILVECDNPEELPDRAWKTAQPLNTHAWSTTWRKHMVRVEVRRALREALSQP
ncbi:MAG: FAD binding domain-containing protein [Myxococcota bacterium]|nr:FAD binding domain-containing protein [Myxococcota bacterium]